MAGVPLLVADSRNEIGPYLVAKSAGQNSWHTSTYVKDGKVKYNEKMVKAGHMVIRDGAVKPMPDSVWNRINSAVDPDSVKKAKRVKRVTGKKPPKVPLDIADEAKEQNVKKILDKHKPPKEKSSHSHP